MTLIKHPEKAILVIVREDYLLVCKDSPTPHCAAILLNIMEYWTRIKVGKGEEAWIYKSYEQFGQDMLGIYGKSTIQTSLKWLVENGLVQRRNNPHNKWDKIPQYTLNAPTVQSAINAVVDQLEKPDRSPETKPSTDQKQAIEAPKTNAAIPVETPETPSSESTSIDLSKESTRVPKPPPEPPPAVTAKPSAGRVPEKTTSRNKAKKADVTATLSDEVKHTFARLSYPFLNPETIWNIPKEAASMRKALKALLEATPEMVTAGNLRKFELWWKQHDWRGQKGQEPRPYNISELWLVFVNWVKSGEPRPVSIQNANVPNKLPDYAMPRRQRPVEERQPQPWDHLPYEERVRIAREKMEQNRLEREAREQEDQNAPTK